MADEPDAKALPLLFEEEEEEEEASSDDEEEDLTPAAEEEEPAEEALTAADATDLRAAPSEAVTLAEAGAVPSTSSNSIGNSPESRLPPRASYAARLKVV